MNPPERESTISTVVVRGLVEVVAQAGVDRSEFLRAARLDPDRLDVPEERVPLSDLYRICELAIERTGDPALGLHWVERLTERAFVPVSHLIAHVPTLRHSFGVLDQFGTLLCDELRHELVEDGDTVTLRFHPLESESRRVRRFSAEMLVGGFVRLVRTFHPSARPERISFDHPAPSYREEYERVFDAKVRFEQPFTGFTFDRASLDAASPHQDDDITEALSALAERRLQRITHRTPYATRAREILAREPRPHRVEMARVADSMDLSVRSLRRRLTAEERSYDDLVDEAFAIVATRLLRDARRTIQEVAYELGFSEASAFHRAFKRCTGTTPRAYRQSQLK